MIRPIPRPYKPTMQHVPTQTPHGNVHALHHPEHTGRPRSSTRDPGPGHRSSRETKTTGTWDTPSVDPWQRNCCAGSCAMQQREDPTPRINVIYLSSRARGKGKG